MIVSDHRWKSYMSKNILVVEDDPTSLEFICYFLRKKGYEVSEARDGVEAIELISPDLQRSGTQ